MKKITRTKFYSKRIGNLAKGCQLCVKGKKLVLFVTGLCPMKCYYCPISETKNNKDVIYANEWKINSDKDIIKEIELCDASGAGITGGDPLVKLDRTVKYIKMFKKKFGKGFHIHLYTPLKLVTIQKLKKLYDAGLDEIRFHPSLSDDKEWNRIELAGSYKWDLGIEIPVIPREKKNIIKLIDYVDGNIKFLNLNELELSDTNASKLLERGYRAKDSISYAVKGSDKLGGELLRYCKNKDFSVHYCTAKLKDKVQLANRIKRRAKNISRDFDIIDDDGMLIRGAIFVDKLYPSAGYRKKLERVDKKKVLVKLGKIMKEIVKKYEVPKELIDIDKGKLRLLIAPWILEEIDITYKKAIIKEYPTWDQLEIEVDFLN